MKNTLAALSIILLTAIACNTAADEQTKNEGASDTVENNDRAIVGTHWKLVKLDGQEVQMVPNQETDIHFILNAQENSVGGFAGCNSILGSYTLEEGMRIRFANMGLTMRACPEVNVDEQAFMNVLELADNYTISNGTLSLNVGRRAPLAEFEAVE